MSVFEVDLAVEFAGVSTTSGLGFNERLNSSLSDRFHERLVTSSAWSALGMSSSMAGRPIWQNSRFSQTRELNC
jgi:hypothetical protein